MVDLHVNLLKNQPTLSEAEYNRERKILGGSVVGAIVVGGLVVALSIWNLVMTSRIAKVQSEITRANQDMQDLTQASASQIYLKSRLKLITGYLSNRSTIRESLQQVLDTGVAGTYVSSANFVGDNVIEVQVTADTSADLRELITYYQENNTYFTNVVSKGISRVKDGTYQITLELGIPKGGS